MGRTPPQIEGATVEPRPLVDSTAMIPASLPGQSTFYLEHSWIVSRDDWTHHGAAVNPFRFSVTVDPDIHVWETDESNNGCEIGTGS